MHDPVAVQIADPAEKLESIGLEEGGRKASPQLIKVFAQIEIEIFGDKCQGTFHADNVCQSHNVRMAKVSNQRHFTQRYHRDALVFMVKPHLFQRNNFASRLVDRSVNNAVRPFAQLLTLRVILHPLTAVYNFDFIT
jgi:hypothetical protein